MPAWDPNAWTGQPLFGQGQPGAAYPFNWLLFLMPLSKGVISMVVLNWYFVLIRCAAALTAYALCRELKCSRAASILGACVFALGGFVGTTGWPQMVNGAVWAPLVLLFLIRADRGENVVSNSLLCGFFLGFAWLSGHHQAPLFITLAAIALWIRHRVAPRTRRGRRTSRRHACFGWPHFRSRLRSRRALFKPSHGRVREPLRPLGGPSRAAALRPDHALLCARAERLEASRNCQHLSARAVAVESIHRHNGAVRAARRRSGVEREIHTLAGRAGRRRTHFRARSQWTRARRVLFAGSDAGQSPVAGRGHRGVLTGRRAACGTWVGSPSWG